MTGLTLLVLAKEPLPGRVKTRLMPDLDPVEAAQVAAAALADTLDVVAAAPAARRVLVLDGAPGPWLPRGFEVVPQVDGGLARRLAGAFAAVEGPALLVGMDTPQLVPADLDVDLETPDGTDAALGLCEDGGYWCIGLRSPRDVFEGVPMSTASTGRLQRERLESAGLSVVDLPLRRDVDTMDDARAVARAAPDTRFAAALARTRAGRCMTSPTDLYDAALRGDRVLRLVAQDGQVLPFDLDRWMGPADATDLALLDRCEGVTLDVGCGPGRMAAAVTLSGRPVLGVDVARASVERTTAAGAMALRRSVFSTLPGEGRWDTVLLVDGNLGIGADPDGLLRRVRELLRPGGLLLVEPEPGDLDERVQLRLASADGGVVSQGFDWVRIGADATVRRALVAGYELEDRWTSDGRTFLALRR